MLLLLVFAFVRPAATVIAVQTAIVFIAQMILITGSLCGAARRKGNNDECKCSEEFDGVFHGNVCLGWIGDYTWLMSI